MLRSASPLLALLLGAAAPVAAQCTVEWSSGGPQPQLSGWGLCSGTWDPDGAGPEGTRLVVGGIYLSGGSGQALATVQTWDGTRWLGLDGGPGTGVNRRVQALTVWNGLLVAGGSFTGGGLSNIALWTGTDWQGLGAGFPIPVQLLTTYNNDLIAISQTGGVPVIQRWNGVTWVPLPPPPSLASPTAAIVYQGHLCVAGGVLGAQGVIERWNGSAWQPTIFAQSGINCLGVRVSLAVGGTDTLYAGGNFTSIGGTTASRIAVTSGGTAFAWSQVGNGLPARCDELHVRSSGLTGTTVVARVNSTTTPMLQLSGSSFVAMGSVLATSLTRYDGSLYATSESPTDSACQRWDGTQWVSVRGPGLLGEVRALARLGDDMVVGGTFTTASGTPFNHVARWDGTTFTPLGAGMTGNTVEALLTLGNGDVVAGGLFLQSGPVALNHIGRWDGTAWSGLGTGMNGMVKALCTLPNGDLVAGGTFTTAGGVACSRVARWDGSTWSPFGTGLDGDVNALAVRGDGTLFAAGAFPTAGGLACNRVAQWTGASWFQVGAGTNGDVHGLAVRPNGDVVAVGAFTSAGGLPANRCARWTGASWAAMGAASNDPTPARAVFVLPDGDVVAGRGLHQPAVGIDDGIARWNGSTWNGLGGGLDSYYPFTVPVDVRAIAQRADGALVVGGAFGAADGTVSHNLAVLSPTCAAAAQSYGSGCSSAAGPIVLTADTLPWIDATFRTTTTGIAANALCAGLIGFTPLSIPLDTLLPEGQPGCTLLTSPDAIVPLVAGPGTAHLVLPFANDPALIGAAFQHQTIPIEFDPSGAILALRASNALELVMGSL